MLIPSRRHTTKDLELWAELEAMDRLLGSGRGMQRLLWTACRHIGEFARLGACYAGISWGKDSIVLAHLCRVAAPQIPLVHLRPTNHNPDCDLVRDAYFTAFPGQTYEEVIVDYESLHAANLPDHELDKETDARWYSAIRDCERKHGDRHILGIRSDESFGRMIRTMRWGISTPRSCAPIARWKTEHIFAYLAANDLPVHPAYACLGGGRWPREQLRVAEIGDTHGKGSGRHLWEQEYYPEAYRRLQIGRQSGPS